MPRVTRARPELTFTVTDRITRSQRQRVRPAFCGASMLPRTDEDSDAALDEFDRIFRRIPPQRGLITTGPLSETLFSSRRTDYVVRTLVIAATL
jgi:hypothetical protein